MQRNLKVEINDIRKIYSIILQKDKDERKQIIELVCQFLDINNDKLKLANYLSSLYKISESEFYVKESFIDILKLIGAFLADVIPIIITSIEIIRELPFLFQ